MVLFLSNDDVRRALGMAGAIDALELAYQECSAGKVEQPQRLNIPAPEQGTSFLRIAACVMSRSGWMGFKAMNLAKNVGVRYQVHIYSTADGALRAIMDGQFLTTLRTGATSAVATKRLARQRAGVVGVLGAGQEALMQLEAMRVLGLVSRARVYSPTPENRRALASFFRDTHALDVVDVVSPEEAVRGSDVVVAAVNSSKPVIQAAWLEPGVHVNSVGTARPTQREIDIDVFRRADIVVVDTRGGVFTEAGDCIAASEIIAPEQTYELADLVGGYAPTRTADCQITLFKSVGTAVQDVAVAVAAYQSALEKGLGKKLDGFPHILEKRSSKPYF
jgi:ornithine cyclodeaminase/alanine dehydrogenase